MYLVYLVYLDVHACMHWTILDNFISITWAQSSKYENKSTTTPKSRNDKSLTSGVLSGFANRRSVYNGTVLTRRGIGCELFVWGSGYYIKHDVTIDRGSMHCEESDTRIAQKSPQDRTNAQNASKMIKRKTYLSSHRSNWEEFRNMRGEGRRHSAIVRWILQPWL